MGWPCAIYQFWHTYGPDFENGAIVLSAIAAFAVIADSRRTAKRRGTLDLILHQESDAELVIARGDFNKIKASHIKPSTYGKPSKKGSKQFETIRKVLNIHELTAVAIKEGVIDECVYRSWFNGTFIADYDAMKDFIAATRITYNNERAFIEFESIALRWKADKSWGAPQGLLGRKWRAMKALAGA